MKNILIASMCLALFWPQVKAETTMLKNSCMVSEIKNIGLNTHDVQARIRLIKDWLKKNANQCNDVNLKTINSNRGSWFGHADTAELHMLLDALYESRVSGKQGILIEDTPIGAKPPPLGLHHSVHLRAQRRSWSRRPPS